MIHLEVAVAVPLPSTLTYKYLGESADNSPVENYPTSSNIENYIGRKVLVPLSGRIVTGYVIATQACSEKNFHVKEVHRFSDEPPFFPSEMVPFFRWVANYYQHPIGEVINTALPAGLKQASHPVIKQKDIKVSLESMSELQGMKIPEWLSKLNLRGKLGSRETKKVLNDKKWKSLLENLIQADYLAIEKEISVATTLAKKEICYFAKEDTVHALELIEDEKEQISEVRKTFSVQYEKELKLAEAKALYHYFKLAGKGKTSVPRKDILARYKNGSKPLRQLADLGILQEKEERVYRNPFGEVPPFYPVPIKLAEQQEKVLSTIAETLEKQVFSPFLLHGVTGSGKTEVYLRATQRCLQMKKTVLVLVPEIALATQLEAHFISRFGEVIALLHSGLTRGERYDQWTRIVQGEAVIVIGARSAIFAPLENIGLIIVDEEHDGGFKQQDGLKYNGRDLAVLRANMCGCVVLLGSATPSVTSYYHCSSGKYRLLEMMNRIGEGGFPRVNIVDLSKHLREKEKSLLHPTFLAELQENIVNNQQSLVLLNRRGFSASYICQDCGSAVQCEHCQVKLTYHKQRGRLICHYCGYSVVSKLMCSNCRSERLIPYGVGTERVEEEIRHHFPGAIIERLDSDTAGDRKAFLAILKAMRERETDILIGTQMIAKGHHFPHVTFVGVVWADGGLNMPDFRAAERTYQLLAQVTGRAGRDELQGRVIIQTMLPDHYAIALAKNHDYASFYQKEISLRRKPAFPPFVRLACLRISGKNEYNVRKTSANIGSFCRKIRSSGGMSFDVLGPAPSPLEKIKDNFRWQILFKANGVGVLHLIWKEFLANSKDLVLGKVEYRLDIDPENMM